MPPDADHVVVAVNPKAGTESARARVDALGDLLRGAGFRPEVLTDLAEVAARANQSHAEGRLRALVGVGGDGTAAELVNRTDQGVPLTMLPAGNENLLARYLRLGQTPQAVCRTIADGTLVRLDAGRAAGRVFLLMISCGFDAEVVRRVHLRRTGHICRRHYARTIWDLVRSYDYPEFRVSWDLQTARTGPSEEDCPDLRADGGSPKGEGDSPILAGTNTGTVPSEAPSTVARWLFGFNLPCYGGGLRLAPQAKGTDGLLDVLTFRRGSLWHGLRYAAAVLLRRHQALADCSVRRVRRLRITSEAAVSYQLDGDPGGMLPVDVEVLSERLTLLVPAAEADRFRRQ